MSFLDERELETGRSAFPRAATLNRRSCGSFSGSVSAPKPGWRVSSPPPAWRKGIFMVPSTVPVSWPAVPPEQLCTRLARSPAQSCWLPIPQGLSGFGVSSETSASKCLQCTALALCGIDHVHSRTWCFTLCSLEVTASQITFSRETLNTFRWCPKPCFFPFLTVQSSFC